MSILLSSRAPSALLGVWLDLEEDGEFQIVAPTTTLAFLANRAWSGMKRAPRLVEWSWPKFLQKYPESMALVDTTGNPRALFCSRRNRPLSLLSGPCYELGYLEIQPSDRGGTAKDPTHLDRVFQPNVIKAAR
jgi:hypothetical protein